MRESELYAKLRPHLASWGEVDRIENIVGSGIADVFYSISGKCGWIETKVAKGDLIYFEKFQPNWLRKHHRQHVRLFVVVLDSDLAIRFYPAGVILKAPQRAEKDKIVVDMRDMPKVFTMPTPYRSWASVRDILTS